MRASVLRDGRMVYRDDVPEPVPGPGQVLVGVKACGICGSDLHFAKHGAEVLELNEQIDGHGGSGGMHDRPGPRRLHGPRVQRRGARSRARHRSPARRARWSPRFRCCCPPTGVEPIVYSNNTIGGYAERMLLSAPLLLPIPNGLDPRHAALTEPMAVGLHAVNKSNDPAAARRRWCSAAGRSASRSSPRCASAAWKPLWQRTFRPTRRELADDDGRAPRPSTRRRVAVRHRQARRWCSRPSACRASSTT